MWHGPVLLMTAMQDTDLLEFFPPPKSGGEARALIVRNRPLD